MALAANLIVYDREGKSLSGDFFVEEGIEGTEVYEFSHRVYTVQKDVYYSLLYGVDFVRKHEPLYITKPVDRMSVLLMRYFIEGTFLPKVEILWYRYDDKTRREIEYFRMTLEHVRMNSIVITIPDVKDRRYERYGHLERVGFCFQKITWLYRKGYLLYTDIWNNGFYCEEEDKDFSGRTELIEDKAETPLVEPISQTLYQLERYIESLYLSQFQIPFF